MPNFNIVDNMLTIFDIEYRSNAFFIVYWRLILT